MLYRTDSDLGRVDRCTGPLPFISSAGMRYAAAAGLALNSPFSEAKRARRAPSVG